MPIRGFARQDSSSQWNHQNHWPLLDGPRNYKHDDYSKISTKNANLVPLGPRKSRSKSDVSLEWNYNSILIEQEDENSSLSSNSSSPRRMNRIKNRQDFCSDTRDSILSSGTIDKNFKNEYIDSAVSSIGSTESVMDESREVIDSILDSLLLLSIPPSVETNFKKELESIYPNLTLSTEYPSDVNGHNFQIRSTIYDQLFIGRALQENEAIERLCRKAYKYIVQHKLGPFANSNDTGKKRKTRRPDERKNKNIEPEDNSSSEFKYIPIKNAVMMLNEMFPPPSAPQYKVLSQTGPPNNPTFTMMCNIENKSFIGEGKSKKEAKLSSSQKAIEVLCGYKVSGGNESTKSVPEKSNPRANCDLDDWMELEGKNPVSILNELYPGIQYSLLSTTGPSHAPNFIIKASLNEWSFEGSGKSKKDAKLNASKALLVHLHKVGFDPMTGDMMSTRENTDSVADGHSFADQIGQLVYAKYQELFGTTTYSKRRVMAAVVMTSSDSKTSPSVICVSSGTKCVNGEQISLEGCVVNDCHAEIVARRCLVLYLYHQLELSLLNSEDSIFEVDDETKLKRLKEGIEFHMFITTSPCGDARIFSLHESSSNKEPELPLREEEEEEEPKNDLDFKFGKQDDKKKMSDSSRGMLRSKIECGMGTVPINQKIQIQTWDGVMSGDRLLTMACSDKILRWNVLGIQGALLTHLIHPIYLHSVTVGSKFHPGHMKRALYGRIAPYISSLPPHYRLNAANLYATTSPESRQATKAHDYSVNWIVNAGQPEIVNGSTGKTINDSTSRLCKRMLFERFLKIGMALANGSLFPFSSPARYSEVKELAINYQSAKGGLNTALIKAGCGIWVEKPVEQDQFSL